MRHHPVAASFLLGSLVLALASTGAEARAGRGLGASIPMPKIGLAPRHWTGSGTGIGAMIGAAASRIGLSGSLRPSLIGEARAAEPTRPPAPAAVSAPAAPAPRPARPPCAAGRLAGSGAGFCQIN